MKLEIHRSWLLICLLLAVPAILRAGEVRVEVRNTAPGLVLQAPSGIALTLRIIRKADGIVELLSEATVGGESGRSALDLPVQGDGDGDKRCFLAVAGTGDAAAWFWLGKADGPNQGVRILKAGTEPWNWTVAGGEGAVGVTVDTGRSTDLDLGLLRIRPTAPK